MLRAWLSLPSTWVSRFSLRSLLLIKRKAFPELCNYRLLLGTWTQEGEQGHRSCSLRSRQSLLRLLTMLLLGAGRGARGDEGRQHQLDAHVT